ncbi:MAG: hypothetical protein KDA28_16520 [Phycisphaerales bacterium]|nr:hypothetical protein [Phycisphaerales bacterium]
MARLILLLLLLASPGVPRALAHPQDGAHADTRVAVDDEAARFSLQMNLVFLDEVVETYREDPSRIHPIEVEGIHLALQDFFSTGLVVAFDDQRVTPVFTSFEVPEPDLTMLPLFPKSGLRGISRVNIGFEYPFEETPRKISIRWDQLPETPPGGEGVYMLEMQFNAEGEVRVLRFTAAEPEQIWHATGLTIEDRFVAVPDAGAHERGTPIVPLIIVVVTAVTLVGLGATRNLTRGRVLVVLAASLSATLLGFLQWSSGSSLPTSEEAVAVFEPLHANIYRAFDYTTESEIYDALARSVEGDELDALYNRIYQSLIMYEEGGAVSRVEKVTPLETEVRSIGIVDGLPGFTVRARWRVLGSVYHFGHSHQRENEYLADYSVHETEGGWRIANSTVVEQKRLELDGTEAIPGDL